MASPKAVRTIESSESLIGKSFGRVTIIGFVGRSGVTRIFRCRCQCGKEKNLRLGNLRTGHTKSCGCLRVESTIQRLTTHDQSKTQAYKAWAKIIGRCENPEDPSYPRYGGRGIKICTQWRESFQAFLDYVGCRPSPEHTLDRYPDNNGNYEPGNVRWATKAEQAKNRRTTVEITLNGKTQCMSDWAKEIGISKGTLWSRIRAHGWSPQKAISTPKIIRKGADGGQS